MPEQPAERVVDLIEAWGASVAELRAAEDAFISERTPENASRLNLAVDRYFVLRQAVREIAALNDAASANR